MSLQPCILEAKEWAEEHSELELSKRDIEEMGRMLEAANSAGASKAERMALMQEGVLKRIEAEQTAKLGESYLNTISHLKNSSNIAYNVEKWGGKASDPADALKAIITGESPRPGLGVNNDPLAATRGNYTRYMEFLKGALTKSELKICEAMERGDASARGITQELYALRMGERVGQSGSDIYMSIAKKMREAQDAVFGEAKSANPYLNENSLYLFGRSHNRALISKVDMATWVADAKAAFGKNLLGDPAAVDAMLWDTYKSIKAGLPAEGEGLTPGGWEHPGTGGSQAIKNASRRVFIANDWKAEADYNAKYGDTPYNAFIKQAQRQAEYVATVDKWGTRSADNFERLFQDTLKRATPEQKDILLKREANLREAFGTTQATRYSDAWTLKGRAAEGLQAAMAPAMLGKHSLNMLSSGPAMLAQIRDGFGMNSFEAASYVMRSAVELVKHLPDGGAEACSHMSVGLSSAANDLFGRLAAGNGEPLGFMSKMARLTGKLSLAEWSTNSAKFGQAFADTRIMGKGTDVPFKELNPRFQDTLNRYDLGGQKWEVLRQAVDNDGHLYPEGVKNIPDEQINSLSTGSKKTALETNRIRGELARNYATMLNERASMTVAQSNSASRAFVYGMSDINETQGIVRNFLGMFRQAAEVRQQLLQRTFRSGGGDTSNWSGVIQYVLQASFMAAVAEQLGEVGAGRQPLDFTDPKIIGHAIRTLGPMGMYSDMFADLLTSPTANKMQSMVQGDFLGPVASVARTAGKAAFTTTQGALQYVQGHEHMSQFAMKNWVDLIHQLTPTQNIPFIKAALDYHVFAGAHEFLGDTGYVGRLRDQMRQHKNMWGEQQRLWGE